MKKFFTMFLGAILSFCMLFAFVGCKETTVDEHIQSISERIRQIDANGRWGYPDGEQYEDFNMYPLYDKNETLKCFLVEFDPYGFMFVKLKERSMYDVFPSVAEKPYVLSFQTYGKRNPWTTFSRNENSPQLPAPFAGETGDLILDENGDIVVYEKSPYFVTGNINEKKYLLETDKKGSIFAVKKDGKFINLISGVELSAKDEYSHVNQATLTVSFLHKGHFLL